MHVFSVCREKKAAAKHLLWPLIFMEDQVLKLNMPDPSFPDICQEVSIHIRKLAGPDQIGRFSELFSNVCGGLKKLCAIYI